LDQPVDRLWFVVVGEVEAKTPEAAEVLPLLRASIVEALKEDVAVMTTWPSGGTPTQAELDAAGRTGVQLDAMITELSITTTSYPEGEFMQLDCAVALVLTSFPSGKAVLTLPSSSSVTGPAVTDTRSIAEECVGAVADGLMREELGAAIQNRR